MKLRIERDTYTQNTTVGQLLIDGDFFCWTLEDTVRPYGIKVAGHTAIPEGIYSVTVTHSPRFNRDMPLIFTEGDDLVAGGIKFEGIRLHGGNTHQNTEGCPLVAFNKIDDSTIQGTAEKTLTKKIQAAIDKGEEVTIEVVNILPNG